jgi:hypothetical protein
VEKDRKGYRSYQFHLETAKKVHEPFKEGAKDYDVCICRDDWGVLRMDDSDMRIFKHLMNVDFEIIHQQKLFSILTKYVY